jgi:peptide deformylase
MAIREIVTPPNPTLRQRAQKVRQITPEIAQLIDDLVETMRVAPGVGLAAPQIDVGLRVIVVEYAEGSEEDDAPEKPPKLYAVINPEITRTSKARVLGNEACLSLPGYFGEVERYERVTVKGMNRHGQDFKLKTNGWLARIFQHEIDHIEGILYIDRATQVWRVEERDDEELPTPA